MQNAYDRVKHSTGIRRARFAVLMLALFAILLILISLALQSGTPLLSFPELVQVLLNGQGDRLTRVVIFGLRLPRVVLALLAGSMLALAGVLLQEVLRNEIAGPELLAVSSGASVVMAAVTLLTLGIPFALFPWFTLLGGLIGGSAVLLSVRRADDPIRVALIGASLSALFNALIIVLISLGTDNGATLLFFYLMGSLANRTWEHVQLVLPWAMICIPLALLSARMLNVLQLGDEMAEGLGLRVQWMRFLLLTLAVGLVTSIVAVSGPIAFIALLAPHMARALLKTGDTRLVLPLSALLGSTLLLFSDIIARTAFAPAETPVGIWTTLLGGPLLLLLLRRKLGTKI